MNDINKCEECKKLTGGFCQRCLYKNLGGLSDEDIDKIEIDKEKYQEERRKNKELHELTKCVYGSENKCLACGKDEQWVANQTITKEGNDIIFIRKGNKEFLVLIKDEPIFMGYNFNIKQMSCKNNHISPMQTCSCNCHKTNQLTVGCDIELDSEIKFLLDNLKE